MLLVQLVVIFFHHLHVLADVASEDVLAKELSIDSFLLIRSDNATEKKTQVEKRYVDDKSPSQQPASDGPSAECGGRRRALP